MGRRRKRCVYSGPTYVEQWVAKEEDGWVRIGKRSRIKYLRTIRKREHYDAEQDGQSCGSYIYKGDGWWIRIDRDMKWRVESGLLLSALSKARELTLNGDARVVA